MSNEKYDNAILNERETTHGDYQITAMIAQELKDVIGAHNSKLSAVQRESLDLICTKIARILSGDSKTRDHWDDIAGYANLVSCCCCVKQH